jgi:outer membrane protein TolC
MAAHRPSGRRLGPRLVVAVAAAVALLSAVSAAQSTLSVEDAILEARSANARLPLRALELSLARERRSEALAERWLKVALESDFLYAPASGYDPALTNLGDARLQVVARQPLYQGGALKARATRADADVAAASARYRMADKDLDLEVRSRFAELLAERADLGVRREGIERLRSYQTWLKSRQASGQGVAADVLKTEVRIAFEEAAIAETEERQDEIRFELNDLLGRDPAAPLELEPLGSPAAPSPAAAASWQSAPEIAAAQAEARSAEAEVTIARADRQPRLFVGADLGFWVADTTHLGSEFWDRFWNAKGYSFSLVLAWPLWDAGSARARVAQADLGLQRARAQVEVERRDAYLAWTQAQTAMRGLFRQIEILSRAAPAARDSYLEMESRYRGGTASALEVLEAHSAAVEASSRLIEATARYRVAQAVAIRWSSP